MCATRVSEGDEGIYGEIVAGMANNIPSHFISLNLSFSNCFHSCSGRGRLSVCRNEGDPSSESYSSEESESVSCCSSSCTFSECTFSGCKTSQNGGGIFVCKAWRSRCVNVIGCRFSACSAEEGNGGGIYSEGSISVRECEFIRCEAKNGGGIYTTSTITLNTTSFQSCNASMDGGGVYADITTNALSIVGYTTFTSCTAQCNGGGISASLTTLLIMYSERREWRRSVCECGRRECCI